MLEPRLHTLIPEFQIFELCTHLFPFHAQHCLVTLACFPAKPSESSVVWQSSALGLLEAVAVGSGLTKSNPVAFSTVISLGAVATNSLYTQS